MVEDTYDASRLLRLAKRVNNARRAYLLVNPIQGKHVPVSPATALSMFRALGRQVSARVVRGPCLLIGFAETATAVATAVAGCLPGCLYIQTTREEVHGVTDWTCFSEEHSHAVQQRLCGDGLQEIPARVGTVVFVDDELTTGKTLVNILARLTRKYPGFLGHPLLAASIIDRVNGVNAEIMHAAGFERVSLLTTLPAEDYTARVASLDAVPAPDVNTLRCGPIPYERVDISECVCPNPRTCVSIESYLADCRSCVAFALTKLRRMLAPGSKLLILGTEECMFPGLVLGEALERELPGATVRFHATTRSPIGVLDSDDYPIRNGYRIHSFYDDTRETYIYNLDRYDYVFVLSDCVGDGASAMADLSVVLHQYGCGGLALMRWRSDVQHI